MYACMAQEKFLRLRQASPTCTCASGSAGWKPTPCQRMPAPDSEGNGRHDRGDRTNEKRRERKAVCQEERVTGRLGCESGGSTGEETWHRAGKEGEEGWCERERKRMAVRLRSGGKTGKSEEEEERPTYPPGVFESLLVLSLVRQ